MEIKRVVKFKIKENETNLGNIKQCSYCDCVGHGFDKENDDDLR